MVSKILAVFTLATKAAVISFLEQSREIALFVINLAEDIQQLIFKVVRKIWDFAVDLVFFVKGLISAIAKWLWTTYNNIEKQFLGFFIDIGFAIYSARYLLFLLLPGIIFFIKSLWIPFSIYVSLLVISIFRRFKLNKYEIKVEENSFTKLRKKIVLLFHIPFRVFVSLCLLYLSTTFFLSHDFLNIGIFKNKIIATASSNNTSNKKQLFLPTLNDKESKNVITNNLNNNSLQEKTLVMNNVNTPVTNDEVQETQSVDDILTLDQHIAKHLCEKGMQEYCKHSQSLNNLADITNTSDYVERISHCKKFFQNDQLTIGNNGSAYKCYSDILSKYPKSIEANQGISMIKKRYIQLIRNKLSSGNLYKANILLNRLKIVDAKDPIINTLRLEIKSIASDLQNKMRGTIVYSNIATSSGVAYTGEIYSKSYKNENVNQNYNDEQPLNRDQIQSEYLYVPGQIVPGYLVPSQYPTIGNGY